MGRRTSPAPTSAAAVEVGAVGEPLAFEGDDEPDGLDDLLVVVPHLGVVHRWFCLLAMRAPLATWRPEMAGLDDRACPECLPDGLVSPQGAGTG